LTHLKGVEVDSCVRSSDPVVLTPLQVGHVQQVSLGPDRALAMRTLSLKPLLFGQ